MKRVWISGSGARYSNGKATFWNEGRSALVEMEEKIIGAGSRKYPPPLDMAALLQDQPVSS